MALLTRLTDTDVAAFTAAYDLPAGVSVRAMPERGTVNSNYAVTDGNGEGSRRWFLRINEGKAHAAVEAEAQLIAFLTARGVLTPEPIATIAGSRVATIAGKPATLFAWIEGHEADESHADAPSQVGMMLGRFHRASVAFPVASAPPNRYSVALLGERLQRIAGSGGYDDVVAIGREELLAAAARDRGPVGVIHQDLFPDNVLVDDAGRFVALLDFEQATVGPLAYDLAVVLNAWCWRGDHFDRAAVAAILSAYDAARERSPAERAALSGELRLAAARFAMTRVTDIELAPDVHPELRARKNYRDYVRRWHAWSTTPTS